MNKISLSIKTMLTVATAISRRVAISFVLVLLTMATQATENQLTIQIPIDGQSTLNTNNKSIVITMPVETGSNNLVAWKVLPPGKYFSSNTIQWNPQNFSWYMSNSNFNEGAIMQVDDSSSSIMNGSNYAWAGSGFEKIGTGATGVFALSNNNTQQAVFGLLNSGSPISADILSSKTKIALSVRNSVRIYIVNGTVNSGQVLNAGLGSELTVDFSNSSSQTIKFNTQTNSFDLTSGDAT